MSDLLSVLPAAGAAYLLGSIPMGVLLARLFGWDDPRRHGSGHTGALNVSRRAGRAALAIVLAADILKGLAAALLAPLISANPWAIPVAGIAAVAGHCWPIWLRFSGGMGLGTGLGAVAAYAWPVAIFGAAVLAIIRFAIIQHTPRAVIASVLLTVPGAAVMSFGLHLFPLHVFALAAGAALLVGARHTADWNRKYE